MKSINTFLLLVITMIWIAGCNIEEEMTPRDYPRLNTLPVSHVTHNGAKLNAEITFRGDFIIESHGFIWGQSQYISLAYSDKVEEINDIHGNKFSIEITTIKSNTRYYVKPFIKTKDYTVLGKAVEFTSKGI